MVGTGIVFRPLVTATDRSRAYGLLDAAGTGYRSPRLCGDERWSGLWDLTAADGTALAAAGATLACGPRRLEVRALVAPVGPHWTAAMGRMVRELADAARAQGVAHLAAASDASDVLGDLGFRPTPGWWVLDL